MRKLAPINLPQNPDTAYDRQLSVMLYQYLRDITLQLNALIDEVQGVNYATQYDQDSASPTFAYFGKAAVGSATSAAVWQIQKLTYGADGDVSVTWAGGADAFASIWDNRASLAYS